MPVINDQTFDLDIPKLEKLAGLNGVRVINSRFKELLPEILAETNDSALIAPSICYEVVAVQEITPGKIKLASGATLEAPLVAHRMAKASHILFGIATIGGAMAKTVNRCFKDGKNLKAILMEEVANAALFETANGLHSLAEEQASRMGLSISGPLSPGDHDGFGLDQQAGVLALARAERVGITMTKTGQMHPLHSASVVIGLGRKMRKWTRIDDCKTCKSRKKCSHYLRSLESTA
jgi:hypothetical protein